MEYASKVRTCFWFEKGGHDAAQEYVTFMPDRRIEAVRESGQSDDPMVVEFTLAGAPMMILTAGPDHKLTPAASISVPTEEQDETELNAVLTVYESIILALKQGGAAGAFRLPS